MHRRLLHPCPARLRATLAEQGVAMSVEAAKELSDGCITCKLKNSVHHSVPRSTGRRLEVEFGSEVAWDLGYLWEPGYNGEKFFSLLVDSDTLWWDIQALRSKGDAPDHLTKWIAENGPPEKVLSDNAKELISVRVRLLCRDSRVYLSTVPPYESRVNGVAERAIREVRALLRTAVTTLEVPASIWPVLLPGIAEVHNKTVSLATHQSPYKLRYGTAPDLTLVLGDEVALKPPKAKTEPKTLQLPSQVFTYVARLNARNILLFKRSGKDITVVRAHPSAITHNSILPAKTATALGFSFPCSSDSEGEETPAVVPQPAPIAALGPTTGGEDRARIFNQNDFGASWQRQQSPRIDTGRSSHSSEQARSLQPGDYAVARIPRQREEAYGVVKILGGATSRSTQVAWQRVGEDGTLTASETDSVPSRTLQERIELDQHGNVAPDIVQRTRQSGGTKEETVLYLGGQGGTQKNAKSKDVRAGEFKLPMIRETISLIRHGVIGPRTERTRNTMTTGWRLTEKQGADGTFGKARLYCRGFMNKVAADTYIGTPSLSFLFALLIYALYRKWEIGFLDIKSAFLQVPLERPDAPTIILGNLPEFPEQCPLDDVTDKEWESLKAARLDLRPGETRRLSAALYGECTSPRLFGLRLKETLQKKGFEEIEESVAVRKGATESEAVLGNHVDDIMAAAPDVCCVFNEVRENFECNDGKVLREGVSETYLGSEYCLDKGTIVVNSRRYVRQIVESDPSEFELRVREVRPTALAKGQPEETSPELQREYRGVLGVLGWATRLTPDQHVSHSEFGAHSACPAKRHLEALKTFLLTMYTYPPPSLSLCAFDGTPTLHGFCDASYDREKMQCRTGFKLYLDGPELGPNENCNMVAWETKRPKAKIASSTSAELLALLLLVKGIWRYFCFVEKLWGEKPSVYVYVDNKPLVQQLRKGYCQEEPRLNAQLSYVAENLKALDGKVTLIPREKQRADAMTKMVKWW
eukprot:GHVU01034451.1.p1 GENE.GHVU01034451.1~~GHVU01034451.1.p1  ORF type:complete len:984 (+),score=104.50 GHVU01034451.1:229-3180(+)